jgi:hypothetical protein
MACEPASALRELQTAAGNDDCLQEDIRELESLATARGPLGRIHEIVQRVAEVVGEVVEGLDGKRLPGS